MWERGWDDGAISPEHEHKVEAWSDGDVVEASSRWCVCVPYAGIVLTTTAKRVKIEAEDDGWVVIRYLVAESLQRQD